MWPYNDENPYCFHYSYRKWQHFKPAHGGVGRRNEVWYILKRVAGPTMSPAPISPSLFPLLNTALQVWILCPQRNGGPRDGWILGKLESLWNLLKNVWRGHQNSYSGVQQTRVSPRNSCCRFIGIAWVAHSRREWCSWGQMESSFPLQEGVDF